MKPTVLAFSLKEALELVQYHNPKYWEHDLAKPETNILRKQHINQLTLTKAMDAILEQNNHMADNIYTMAAFQNIMNKKVEEYNKIIEDINLINTQVEHLETNRTITEKDKSELRNFYMDRLKFNERKRKLLLASKEVRNALRVEFEEVSATVKR